MSFTATPTTSSLLALIANAPSATCPLHLTPPFLACFIKVRCWKRGPENMWGTHKNKKIVDLRLLPNLAPNKCDTYVDVRNNMRHMFEGILHCFISDYFDLTHLALITRPWEKSQLIFRDSSVYTIPREGVAAYMTMTGNGFPNFGGRELRRKTWQHL